MPMNSLIGSKVSRLSFEGGNAESGPYMRHVLRSHRVGYSKVGEAYG